MLRISHAFSIDGTTADVSIYSPRDTEIDATGLTVLPAAIDPHVHFRIPGAAHKEDWQTASMAALRGGITAVCDMPNNRPACVSAAAFYDKQGHIDAQLNECGIPLRYYLYLGADREHLDEIPLLAHRAVALKIFMGSSTGSLLVDDEASLNRAFALAAAYDLLVAVHAEDEAYLRQRHEALGPSTDPAHHSVLRDRHAAARAVERAIALARDHGARLAILHVSTPEELALIRAAKQRGQPVYAEATPHHLYLSDAAYAHWGTKVMVNPPLRTEADVAALWEAVADGTIDWIGSDHAPHTLEEKGKGYPAAPSGVPGVEMLLPLMLHAHLSGKLSLERVVALTSGNVRRIFRLPTWDDLVLVDLQEERLVTDAMAASKCGWTPYAGLRVRGWPKYTILKGKAYAV